MKGTAQTLSPAAAAERSWLAVYADLVKARLSFLVLLTTSVGFYLGSPGAVDFYLMFHLLTGTAMIAAGAAALNQLIERDLDARMRRTCGRPLPSGKLQPETVLLFGTGCAAVGLVYLAVLVNARTCIIGAVTLATYIFVYTPLKRVTWLNTIVGAIPGGLPPLMGWVAARDAINLEGGSLFAVQFLWQIPHFLAIAWLYREDYAQAGFRMLSVNDRTGRKTGLWAVGTAVVLLGVSLLPTVLGLASVTYFVCALALGLLFAGAAAQFALTLTMRSSRQLFWASILYLPLLLGVLVLDKIK